MNPLRVNSSLIRKVAPTKLAGTQRPKAELRKVFPIIWELVRPRRGLLAIGLFLMVINRVSGLVLPYSRCSRGAATPISTPATRLMSSLANTRQTPHERVDTLFGFRAGDIAR
jgi:hypothetical protein